MKENEVSYFFEIENEYDIISMNDLLELSKKRLYSRPGEPHKFEPFDPNDNFQDHYRHNTSGLFRGQFEDWVLNPTAYRDKKYKFSSNNETIESRINSQYRRDNRELISYCDLASKQNLSFPKDPLEQMVIAQHYGINTPILDWTSNIMVAIYFAIDANAKPKDNGECYIYHIKDERLLNNNDNYINIFDIRENRLVQPFPIDRRVERQFSLFTFHPHPLFLPKKTLIDKYKISENLFFELLKLLEGLGFSSSHYFPDYAGLADRIKKGYML